MSISVQCQHRTNGNQCSNRTSNPVGLCHFHINSKMVRNDINHGHRLKPVMTTIPMIGGARAQVSGDTKIDPNDNQAVVNQMQKDWDARKEFQKPSLGKRIRDLFS